MHYPPLSDHLKRTKYETYSDIFYLFNFILCLINCLLDSGKKSEQNFRIINLF